MYVLVCNSLKIHLNVSLLSLVWIRLDVSPLSLLWIHLDVSPLSLLWIHLDVSPLSLLCVGLIVHLSVFVPRVICASLPPSIYTRNPISRSLSFTELHVVAWYSSIPSTHRAVGSATPLLDEPVGALLPSKPRRHRSLPLQQVPPIAFLQFSPLSLSLFSHCVFRHRLPLVSPLTPSFPPSFLPPAPLSPLSDDPGHRGSPPDALRRVVCAPPRCVRAWRCFPSSFPPPQPYRSLS